MIYLSAQPDNIYFHWQLEVQFLNFKDLGIPLSSYHVLVGIKEETSKEFLELEQKYPEVKFSFIKDTRERRRYIPSIRPHIISKYFQSHPELSQEQIFYFDADVIFREKLDFDEFGTKQNFVSDTDSYLGVNYITSKGGEKMLEEMCNLLKVDRDKVRQIGKHGGAQYFFQPGLTSEFWKKIENDCSELYNYLQNSCHIYAKWWSQKHGKPVDDYHEIQSWCADMWCVLWNLVYVNREVSIHDELKFSWATSTAEEYNQLKIFHNAGVTDVKKNELFYKGQYIKGLPDNLDLSFVSEKTASYYYSKYVQRLVEEKKEKI